jgi:hypothetical protein
MESSAVSNTARSIAAYWAEGRDRSAGVVRGYARQVQDHLDHGADPDYLKHVAGWMSLEKPGLLDIDLALSYGTAPAPSVVARSGHPCRCRGRAVRPGGAPAPALVRQLIRRPATRVA